MDAGLAFARPGGRGSRRPGRGQRLLPAQFVADVKVPAQRQVGRVNLFFRELPRLSVDLDLVLRDHTLPWKQARKCIDGALAESRQRLEAAGFKVAPGGKDGEDAKLHLSRAKILVKVEVNYVMRGTLGRLRQLFCRAYPAP